MWADYLRTQREKISRKRKIIYSQQELADDLLAILKKYPEYKVKRLDKVLISKLERKEITGNFQNRLFLRALVELFKEKGVEIRETLEEVERDLQSLTMYIPHGVMAGPILIHAFSKSENSPKIRVSSYFHNNYPVFVEFPSRISPPTYAIGTQNLNSSTDDESISVLTASQVRDYALHAEVYDIPKPDLIVLPGDVDTPRNFLRIASILYTTQAQCTLLFVTGDNALADKCREREGGKENTQGITILDILEGAEKKIDLYVVKDTISQIQAEAYIYKSRSNFRNIFVSVSDFHNFKTSVIEPKLQSSDSTFVFLCWPPFTSWVQDMAKQKYLFAKEYDLTQVIGKENLRFFSFDILGHESLLTVNYMKVLDQYLDNLDDLISIMHTSAGFWHDEKIAQLALYLNMHEEEVVNYGKKLNYRLANHQKFRTAFSKKL